MEGPAGPEVTINGKKYLYFAGTGYYSLQTNTEIIQAANEASLDYGIGSATSRSMAGTTPLLLEIVPVVDRAGCGVKPSVVEAAPASVTLAHVGHAPVALTQVLSHRDVYLLGPVRVVRVPVDLRVSGFPVPGVGRVDQLEGPVGTSQREKLPQFRADLLRVADHQRLALPMEP